MATKQKERVSSAPEQSKNSPNGGPPIPAEKLKQIYATMLKCRTMEERIRVLFKQGRFGGNYYAAVGQEATEVGCAVDLRPTDTVAPSHRDFIANPIKGTPLNLMLSQIYALRIRSAEHHHSRLHYRRAVEHRYRRGARPQDAKEGRHRDGVLRRRFHQPRLLA